MQGLPNELGRSGRSRRCPAFECVSTDAWSKPTTPKLRGTRGILGRSVKNERRANGNPGRRHSRCCDVFIPRLGLSFDACTRPVPAGVAVGDRSRSPAAAPRRGVRIVRRRAGRAARTLPRREFRRAGGWSPDGLEHIAAPGLSMHPSRPRPPPWSARKLARTHGSSTNPRGCVRELRARARGRSTRPGSPPPCGPARWGRHPRSSSPRRRLPPGAVPTRPCGCR